MRRPRRGPIVWRGIVLVLPRGELVKAWFLGKVAERSRRILEREEAITRIRSVLGVDEETARQLARDHDPVDVVNAGALGWKPDDDASPRLFVLVNRVPW